MFMKLMGITMMICFTLKQIQNSKWQITVIIANTIKGKGISYMEDVTRWHNTMPNKDEIKIARKDLKTNTIK